MRCPKCNSINIRRERSPDGKVDCKDCGFVIRERGQKLPSTPQDYEIPPVKKPKSIKVLRTNNGFYVHELRGACFVTWVSEQDKEQALQIPDNKANGLQNYVWDATRVDTEIVDL